MLDIEQFDMNAKLKTTTNAIAMLDLIGSKYPASLALVFQLLNTDGNVLALHEVRSKTPKKAIDMLRRHGLVEVSKDIVQLVYLIESEIVEHPMKKAAAKRKETWKDKLESKGVDSQKVGNVISGDSRSAVFYRNEIADNWDDSDDFKLYKSFVVYLFTGNFDDPFKRVLAIPSQVGYKKFIKTGMGEILPDVKEMIRNMENYTKKDYADLAQTLSKWFERKAVQ
jgi:hypothetical protein